MIHWKTAAATAAVALAALAAGVLVHRAQAPRSAPATPPAAVAKSAHPPGSPEQVARFLDATFADPAGGRHRPNDWAGKVRVINFWATWCAPCREEMPVFEQAQRSWSARGVQVVGVAVDSPAAVARFTRELGIGYPQLMAEADGLQWMTDLGNSIGALPFTLIVDGEGRVLQRYAGPVNKDLLDNWLKAAQSGR